MAKHDLEASVAEADFRMDSGPQRRVGDKFCPLLRRDLYQDRDITNGIFFRRSRVKELDDTQCET